MTKSETCPLCRRGCTYSEIEFDYIKNSLLPDTALVYSPGENNCVYCFDTNGNAICTTRDCNEIIAISIWNFLKKQNLYTLDIKISTSLEHTPCFNFGFNLIAVSRRTDTFKYVIDVVDITNQVGRREVTGLHWEPKKIYFNNSSTLLACLCTAQITVWNVASGNRVHTFPNLRINCGTVPRIAFGVNNFLHVYYTNPKVLLSYNMLNGDLERYIDLGVSKTPTCPLLHQTLENDDYNILDVYEKHHKCLLFGEEYLAKVSHYWKRSQLDIYHIKDITNNRNHLGPNEYFDRKISINIKNNEGIRNLAFNGLDTLAVHIKFLVDSAKRSGLIRLFTVSAGQLLKTFDMRNISIFSLVYYEDKKLACIDDRGVATIWKT